MDEICTPFPIMHVAFGFVCGECRRKNDDSIVTANNFKTLEWQDVSDNARSSDSLYKIGTIEFCQEGPKTFGYRLPNDDSPCGELAPLIRMQPGVRYQLRFINTGQEATNVHTHGLHIAGDGNADDITRQVSPGKCLFYNWTLPADHMDGTFWYHAHLHTRSRAHVNGGALGLLLVDAAPSKTANRPQWIADFRRERLLLLATNTLGMTANGKTQERITLNAGEWYYLRVLLADPDAPVRDLIFGPACQVHAAAYDGVWRTTVPHPTAQARYTASGSNRIDFAIQCSQSEGMWWGSTLIENELVVFNVRVGGEKANGNGVMPLETWIPPRPDYLTDLRNEVLAGNSFQVELDRSRINDEEYDKAVPLGVLDYDSLQQWNIVNSGVHPFHLHVFHMQIVSKGGCGNIYEEGEWYDSIASVENMDCQVRFRMVDFGGRVIMHCHTLEHEDNGSMGWVNVTGGPGLYTELYEETSCDTVGDALLSEATVH